MPLGRQTALLTLGAFRVKRVPLPMHHWSRLYAREQSFFCTLAPFAPVFGLGRSEVKHMRQPDPVTLQRVSKLLGAARALLVEEITIVWLARILARVDGGPMLDAPRLGPALRMPGFQCTRRRGVSQGERLAAAWRFSSAPRPPTAKLTPSPGINQRGLLEQS